ncbi:sensor histidine kinase [Thiomicrorhabdus indica]|uniref:sensor histidine kinase n=1 Tax=Thiomicrorhabdus indica TaxID=2267253 RepID=UPI00102DD977|nr:ATP-binding protein [Thiomicrorhabdus indica]
MLESNSSSNAETDENSAAIREQRIQELEKAFEMFNQTSDRLSDSYHALQSQMEELQEQLAQSDKEKKQVADRLSRLLKMLPAAVVVLDQKDQIVEMNQSAIELLGEDALHRNWEIVVMNVFLNHNDAGQLITHDDQIFQVSETLLDESLGKILLMQDVTEAKQLQEHQSRHQRLHSMGEMAASLAHQIRTPLASALLYVSQLNVDDLQRDQRYKFVDKTLNSLRHLEGLVKDMLQYAKGGKSCEQDILLSDLYDKLAHQVEVELLPEDAQVRIDRSEESLHLSGDMDALVTALQNLVHNALEVIGIGAQIQVSAKVINDNFLDLIVMDNGPGIEPEKLEQIFEPFYTSRAKGTGLGLAVVRAIAEAHSGEVWVKSIVGYGSRFGIRLPLQTNSDKTGSSLQSHLIETKVTS